MTKEYSDYLAHYGVRGQKWGQRRYQNEDGTLTEEGKRRKQGGSSEKEDAKKQNKSFWEKTVDRSTANTVGLAVITGAGFALKRLLKNRNVKNRALSAIKGYSGTMIGAGIIGLAMNAPIAIVGQSVRAAKNRRART